MTEKEGIEQGKLPIMDFIPSDTPCVVCGKDNCDTYSVIGYSHNSCRSK